MNRPLSEGQEGEGWATPWVVDRGETTAGGAESKSHQTHGACRGMKVNRKRRQRKKGRGTLSIFYLNMHGGRREPNWEELYGIMDSEGIDVVGLVETHLRDSETPLEHSGYIWEGLNWQYLWTGIAAYAKNLEILACLEEDMEHFNLPVIIVGDFNAHMAELDRSTDRMGEAVMEWAARADLVMVNGTDRCTRTTTWASRDKTSCIDYCFVTPMLLPRLTEMSTDTDGLCSMSSDHNSIRLTFGGHHARSQPRLPTKGPQVLPDQAIVEAVDRLQWNREMTPAVVHTSSLTHKTCFVRTPACFFSLFVLKFCPV